MNFVEVDFYMTRDLTKGSPMKNITGFMIPLMLGLLFQQFYNVVDTMIVGKILGVKSLEAVGTTGSLSFLVMGFAMGICAGFAIPQAQMFGAKDEKNLRIYFASSIELGIVISLLMAFFTVMFCKNMLLAMETPEAIIDLSYSYIVIIFAGLPVTILYNVLSGAVRSVGDSRSPVIFLAAASVMNIGLDFLFILVFKMGVSGAALATVISQAFSSVCCFVFIMKKLPILKVRKEEWKFSGHHAAKLLQMGVPMGLQFSVTAIGTVVLQRSVNTLGEEYIASVTSAQKISMFFTCPFDAMGTTMATYGGQNVGAGKFDRLGKGLIACSMIGVCYSAAAFAVLTLFGDKIAILFLDPEETAIIANVEKFLFCNSVLYPFLAMVNIVRYLIQGMGYSAFAIIAGVLEMAARAGMGALIVPIFGFSAVCFANPAAWIMADMFLIPAYFYVKRRVIKLSKERVEIEKAVGIS